MPSKPSLAHEITLYLATEVHIHGRRQSLMIVEGGGGGEAIVISMIGHDIHRQIFSRGGS